MNLQPYRVLLPATEGGTAPSPSLLDRACKEVGSWPTPAKIVGGAAAGALVALGAVALAPLELGGLAVAGIATAAGVVTGTATSITDFYINNERGDYLKLVDSKIALQSYRAYENLGFLKNGFYIEHPHRDFELISAKSFHEVMENEQTQEILRFIRSQVKATSIRILRKK